MLRQVLLGIGAVLVASPLASASQIIAPVAWGPTNDNLGPWGAATGLTGGERMFNGQQWTSFANGVVTNTILDTGLVHWVRTADVVGGASNIADFGNWGTPNCLDNYNGWFSTSAWIDFGADYASVRIEQTWTHVYLDNSPTYDKGGATRFVELFWDNDNNSEKSASAVAETRLNFITQATQAAGTWAKDVDLTGSPVTPSARYLILKAPFPAAPPVDEFAFVGTVVPEPATLGLLGVATVGLLQRRRRGA